MAKQPVLERLLLYREPLEEITLIESGRLSERRRGSLGRPQLELAHIYRHRVWIEGHCLTIHRKGLRVGVTQALPERVQRLTEACPRRCLHRVPPEEARQLVSGVGQARRQREIGHEGLRLPRR